MKRLILAGIGALAGLAVVLVTNYERIFSPTTNREQPLEFVAANEDGQQTALVDRPADPGQRREIATTMQQVAAMDDQQWTKSFVLTGSDGKKISSEDLKGQPYIVNFFFSTCQASCKQQTDQVRLLQQKYKSEPIRFVSISVDPEHDTPETLAAYATAADAIPGKWLFLTGDIKQIAKLGGEMFLLGGLKRYSHPDRLCLVNADGILEGKYNWHSVEEVEALHQHIDELLSKSDELSAGNEVVTPLP